MRKYFSVLLVMVMSTALFAADSSDTDVKDVIQKFQQAVERHNIAAVGSLVAPDIVVLENGHRNDGWIDFRDNHLIPEFKEPAAPSKWEFVKVVARSEMAWGYTKQTIDATSRNGKSASHLVWSMYVLQKSGPAWKVVLLDWSVRTLSSAGSKDNRKP